MTEYFIAAVEWHLHICDYTGHKSLHADVWPDVYPPSRYTESVQDPVQKMTETDFDCGGQVYRSVEALFKQTCFFFFSSTLIRISLEDQQVWRSQWTWNITKLRDNAYEEYTCNASLLYQTWEQHHLDQTILILGITDTA